MSPNYSKPKQSKKPGKGQSKNRRKPPPRQTSAWTLLLSGFFTGVLTCAASIYWYHNRPMTEAGIDSEEVEQADPKPHFDFYTRLKESEVFVPEVEQSPTNQAASNTHYYLLQAGSFRRYDDADGLRAQLLLLNLSARVETAGTKPGETWHRVLVGPFSSRSKVADARSALLENGIDNILLKRKRD